jgi:5,5'-dehydrodivanillate O-demethylase
MVTRDENDRLTHVGRGTPGGELLRRYWQPVLAAAELTDETPIKAVRRLGEDLVAYRTTTGEYGLVGEQCPHRLASLAYGQVDDEGIRCPYHGWKYNAAGRCLEQPAEPPGSKLKDEVQHTAYPVEILGGLLFAFMGPLPAPPLPRWDVLAWEHGTRWVQKHSLLNCSWLQAMENSVDPAHLYWLHGRSAHLANSVDHYAEDHEFITFDYGIMKRRVTPGPTPDDPAKIDQHPLIFPNTLRHVLKDKINGAIRHNVQCRVPVDDSHTQVYMVLFEPSDEARTPAQAITPLEYYSLRNEDGGYRLDKVLGQDAMAWETQGPIMDRTRELLGVSDMGVVKFRRLLEEQMDIVRHNGVPMGIVPVADKNRIIEFNCINDRIGVTEASAAAPADQMVI